MRAVMVVARRVLRGSAARSALLVFVLATSVGFALFSATAARRTGTAFDRFVTWSGAADVGTSPRQDVEEPDSTRFDELAALPVVVASQETLGIATGGAEVDDKLLAPARFSAAAIEGDVGDPFDRVLVLKGSIPPDPTASQGFVDFSTARELDIDIGDEVTLFASTGEGEPETPLPIEVVAIVSAPSLLPTVSGYQHNAVVMGPRFVEEHPELVDPYESTLSMRLRDGLDSIEELREQMEDAGLGDIPIGDRGTVEVGAERLFTLEATTMWAATLLALLVGLPVAYQLVRRDASATRARIETVLAIGASRRQLLGAAAARGATLAVIAAAIGGVGAVLASRRSPVGLARIAEVERGIYVDGVVLAIGIPSFVAAVALVAMVGVYRGALRAPQDRRRERAVRSRQPRVPVAMGIRMATGSRGAVAVAGIGSLAFVSLLVVGISVAASSLDALPDDPQASGGAWDGFLVVDPSDPSTVEEALANEPSVSAYGLGGWAQLEAQGEPVPTLFLPGSMDPTIAAGSAPRTDREIALGAAVMRRLGLHIGDEVTVSFPGTDTAPRDLTVTGETITASPLFASFPPDEAAVVGFDMPPGLANSFLGELVRFPRDHRDPQATLEHLVADLPEDTVFFSFARARRGDVVALEELEDLFKAILAMAIVLALASLLHQVLVTNRRNASDVGVLRAVGFTRAYVAEAGAAHGGTLAAITAAIAVPVGLAAGTTAWRLLAHELVVLPRTRYDLAAIVAGGVAVVVLASVTAAALAHRSARRPVAAALRTE